MDDKRPRPAGFIFFLLLSIFLLDRLCGTGNAHATGHYDMAREAGDKFVHAYMDVDNVLMGGTGKSKELVSAMEYANARLKYDDFTETWSHLLEMECVPTALDLRTKVKTDIELDWVQRYTDICFKKFIFFHWKEINDSIEKRYAQVSKPEFLESVRVRH